jgi:hypothetical protein
MTMRHRQPPRKRAPRSLEQSSQLTDLGSQVRHLAPKLVDGAFKGPKAVRLGGDVGTSVNWRRGRRLGRHLAG